MGGGYIFCDMVQRGRDARIKDHKHLTTEEKNIGDQAIGDNYGKGLNGFSAGIKLGHSSDKHTQHN